MASLLPNLPRVVALRGCHARDAAGDGTGASVTTPFGYSIGRNRTDAHPQVHRADSFDELQDVWLSARHDRPKDEAPYIARAFGINGENLPQRGQQFAEPCALITLDVDRLTPDAAVALTAALAERRGFWHGSMSATADNLKRRVVLACSRVIQLAEHRHVVEAVEAWLQARVGDGIEFDRAASRDVARIWYLPAEDAAAGVFVGEPVDVDCALAGAKRTTEAEHRAGDGSKTGKGRRNTMLAREAGKMRRIGLSAGELAAALHQINVSRCDPPLPEREVDTIAASVGRYPPSANGDGTSDNPAGDEPDQSKVAIPPLYSENRIARDFVSRHESAVRFVPEWGKWLVWTGAQWRRDDGGEVGGMIGTELARVSGEIIDDVFVAENSGTRQRFARAVNTDKVRRGVEAFTRTDQRIVVRAVQLDCHDHLLNTPAGTVDLRTGIVRDHLRDDFLTRITRVAPTAGASVFSRFLVDVTMGDDALIRYLQQALGACLFGAGYNADHWLMFWHGVGRNGKNTLGDVVAWVLGSYAKTVPTTTLIADEHNNQHPTVIANLTGVRLAISSEIDEGARWSESRIKALTGDEMLTGRFMRADFFEFRRTHRHLIYGNHRPLLSQPDPAITQRLHLVPFNADFSGDRGDPTMPAQLREESGAILQWLIGGAVAYHEDGGTLRKCAAVEAATKGYFEAQSTFDHWLAECTTSDRDARTKAGDLYQSFARWKETRGERPLSQTRWGEEMGRRLRAYNSGGARGYVGIRLLP